MLKTGGGEERREAAIVSQRFEGNVVSRDRIELSIPAFSELYSANRSNADTVIVLRGLTSRWMSTDCPRNGRRGTV